VELPTIDLGVKDAVHLVFILLHLGKNGITIFNTNHFFSCLQTSMWNSLHPNQIIGEPALVMEYDCLKATLEETAIVRSQFRIPLDSGGAKMAGFAGWFDVHFRVRFCIHSSYSFWICVTL